ncbi:unnamed protein product [Vitrella brassicaformis CCMP3155]|uniref:AP2/ERF domain-containing protein n=1 Tax=Vitrella brassicaformis (strain CCMP3155) TaxID=1169540 RepID=A0A0G4EMZ9_VITBC|nr:unnamed protein product [Vitrella brassicaformis CCMP3155]|eukprot:CEL98397.1 unnamed protein product [Vitrella brassicaformis CCMP3155]
MDRHGDMSLSDGQPRRKATQGGKTVIPKPAQHQSDVSGVRWLEQQQAWVSSWYEGGKEERKYFYVSEHGFDKAKALAEQHRREMERTGRAAIKKRAEHQSGVRGVHYKNNAWVATWKEGGQTRTKSFSVKELGHEVAKNAAIAHRQAMQEQHYTFLGSDGQPVHDPAPSPNSAARCDRAEASRHQTPPRHRREGRHTPKGGAVSEEVEPRGDIEVDRPPPGRRSRKQQASQSSRQAAMSLSSETESQISSSSPHRPGQGDPPRRPAPKRQTVDRKGAHDEADVDGLTGPVLATALVNRLVRRFNDACPPANGGFGVCMTSPRRFAAYFDSQGKHLGFRKFVIDAPDSRDSIIEALRQCVAYRNTIHRDKLGDHASVIDLSWLDRQQEGSGSVRPEGSLRDESADHSPSRKHRRRDTALSSSSKPSIEGKPRPQANKTARDEGEAVTRKAAEHQSHVSGVSWYAREQSWKAKWYEKSSGNEELKTFYVKDHGFDKAKALAEQHRLEMDRTGQAAIKQRSKHQSGVRGVRFDKTKNAWEARWQVGGRRKSKSFSVKQLGYGVLRRPPSATYGPS